MGERWLRDMAELQTNLFGHWLHSPLILASGPRSYGAAGIQAAFDSGAAGVVTKTLRLEPAINPVPHIVRPIRPGLGKTLFNSEQWSDLTWERWVRKELPALRGHPGLLIASIGHTAEEAAEIVNPVVRSGTVDAIECVAYVRRALAPLVQMLRQETDLPILAKLTFNWGEDFFDTAESALDAGASGFTAIDSLGPTLQIDIEASRPLHGGENGMAWMSGAAIKPIAVGLVAELVKRFDVPVIGTGGAMRAEDVIEYIMVGARAVGACTAPLLSGCGWFSRTKEGISAWLDAHDYATLDEIRGVALPRLRAFHNVEPMNFRFEPTMCTLCRQCVVVCPYDARLLTGKEPRNAEIRLHLDSDRCRSCGLCVESCKPGALAFTNWPK